MSGARGIVEPSSSRTSKGIKREQQILEIAEQLFHRNGYAETAVGDIAEASGLLKGSLYYYMDSKEDLLYRIVIDVHEVSHRQLEVAKSRSDLSAVERIILFVHAQLVYNAEYHTRVAVYHHEWRRLEGARLDEVRKGRQEYDHALSDLIRQAITEGDLQASTDIRLTANTVLAVICWPYTWYRNGHDTPEGIAKFGADFVRAALRGLGAG